MCPLPHRATLEEIKKYAHLFVCLWHVDHALHDLVLVRGAAFKGMSKKGGSSAFYPFAFYPQVNLPNVELPSQNASGGTSPSELHWSRLQWGADSGGPEPMTAWWSTSGV